MEKKTNPSTPNGQDEIKFSLPENAGLEPASSFSDSGLYRAVSLDMSPPDGEGKFFGQVVQMSKKIFDDVKQLKKSGGKDNEALLVDGAKKLALDTFGWWTHCRNFLCDFAIELIDLVREETQQQSLTVSQVLPLLLLLQIHEG